MSAVVGTDEDELAEAPLLLADVATASPPQAIGVTLIAGFLGSGKSTLVRRLLTESHGMRLLVVENEFGDRVSSSIESAIVTASTSDEHGTNALAELVELPNGCVCCAASHDLTSALARLLRARGPRRFDHIVIEASGLADPGPVAAAFWVDEELETMLRLDAIVTVVDAEFLSEYLGVFDGELCPDDSARLRGGAREVEDVEKGSILSNNLPKSDLAESEKARLAEKQIAIADAVLLNKVDLLDLHPLKLHRVRKIVLERKSPATNLLETVRCNAPLEMILNLNAYDRSRCLELLDSDLFVGPAVHPTGVRAISLTFEGVEFDRRILDRVFGMLLWEEHRESGSWEIWRAKALVAIQCEPCSFLYQIVHTLFEGEATARGWDESETKISKFVFIGRGLIEDALREALTAAIV